MANGIVSLDKGFYQEARSKGLPPLTYLTELVNPEPPEIEAVAQRCLARFGQRDDGTARARRVRQYAYDIAGLEKELSVRGVRTSGPGAHTVEKLFSSTNQTPLFPVYLASQIIAGQLAGGLISSLVATDITINSHVAEKITITDTATDRSLRLVAEGTDLPKTKIQRAEGSISLTKYGRLLEVTYESVRLMQLDILGLMLQRIGMQIAVDQTDDLIETLIAGDGTAGSAVVDTDAEVSGTLDYDELVRLRLAFPIGYEMTDAITNDANMRTLLNMSEFKDPMAGFSFQRTGDLGAPLGARWHRWTSTGSASFSTDRILAVDNRGAAALFREDALLEESDQLIDKQLWRRTVSEWVGIMKLDNNATQCLDIVNP
jgi:hypothetical protein